MPYEQVGSKIDIILADVDTRLHVMETNPPASGGDLTDRVVALEEADEVLHEGLASHDQALLNLNTRVTGVDTKVDVAQARADLAKSDVELAEQAISGLGSSVAGLQTSVATLATDGSTTSQRVTSLQQADAGLQDAVNALSTRVSAVENGGTTVAANWPGHVLVGSFPGSNTTEKFRAALAYAASASDGRKPAIILEPGSVLNPGTTPFMLHSGAAVLGGVVPQTEFSSNSRVTISGAAPNGVFDHANDARSIVIANIGWEGPGTSQVCRFMADGSNRLCYSLFDGVSFDNFTSVMRKKFLGFLWQGSGYCNNSSETPFEFSGSDYKVFTDGYYLDSPNLPDTAYLLHIKSGNKVLVGSVFVTGDGPTPVRVSSGQHVRLLGLETEAEGVPRKTAGAALFVSGGNVMVDNLWAFRTMVNPAATGRGDNGVVHVEGNGTLVHLNAARFGEWNNDFSTERPAGYTENHVYAGGSAQVYLNNVRPWNMQANSGTGGTTGARALKVGKGGTGQIFQAQYSAL